MKAQIVSIFEQIAEQVNSIKDLAQGRQSLIEFVQKTKVNDKDKKLIVYNISEAKNIYALQKYVYNSLLKYEGMGMNQINKTAREAAAETELA